MPADESPSTQNAPTRTLQACAPQNSNHIMMPDMKHALRMLMKTPGFTATAIITLALAIGAATTIFSVFDAVPRRWFCWR